MAKSLFQQVVVSQRVEPGTLADYDGQVYLVTSLNERDATFGGVVVHVDVPDDAVLAVDVIGTYRSRLPLLEAQRVHGSVTINC